MEEMRVKMNNAFCDLSCTDFCKYVSVDMKLLGLQIKSRVCKLNHVMLF